MFQIGTEAELIHAFRPRDQHALALPAQLPFPLVVRGYFAWVEPTGVRTFVVFQDPTSKRPLGIAFRRDQDQTGGSSQLCDWCHSVGEDIGLLTTDRNSKKRIGVVLCRDLSCAKKLDDAADLSGTSSVVPKRQQLERMQRFAREGLGIQAVP